MRVTILKLYDKVRENRDGEGVQTALFKWDGENRCVPVLVKNAHVVGDEIEVRLREVYSREKNQGFKWWECVE